MAALASSAVTLNDNWTSQGNNGKKYSFRNVTLVLTGQGTVANPIPASALGLTKVIGAYPLTKSDDSLFVLGASNAANSVLLLKAAADNVPADYSGTFTGTVYGTI